MRVEHQAAVAVEMNGLPELIDPVSADRVDVDHAGEAPRPIADQAGRRDRREADAQIESVADRGVALDQPDIGMNLAQAPVAHPARLLAGVELLADAAAEPDLVQPRAVTHLDRESARADLGEERAGIAFLDRVEAVLPVGDQPGEHIEAAGRAFRVGEAGDGRAQLELLDQRHEIDAAGFQHRALGQIDLVEFQLGELVAHRGVGPRQETRPDAIGHLAEPKIEARRLDLIGFDVGRGHDLAAGDHGADGLARQNAGAGEHALRPFGRRIGLPLLGQGLEQPIAWAGWLHGPSLHLFYCPAILMRKPHGRLIKRNGNA